MSRNPWLVGMVLQVGQECLGGKVERIMESPLHSPHPQSDSWGRWVGCLPAVNQASDHRGIRPAPRANILCASKPGGRRTLKEVPEMREAEGEEVPKPSLSLSLLPGTQQWPSWGPGRQRTSIPWGIVSLPLDKESSQWSLGKAEPQFSPL